MARRTEELKNTTYELFIAGLSVLSIVNIGLILMLPGSGVAQVATFMDRLLSIIFMVDFLFRFFSADPKARYFFHQFGWADLLASLPFPHFKVLRMFRILRVGRLMREFGAANMVRVFIANRAQSALLTLLFLIVLVLEFGGMAMLSVESRSPNGNIKNASDAIWYTYVTITTVGYGDRYPVTLPGRVLGMLIMTAGVGLFGTLTGYLATAFLAPKKEPEAEPAPQAAGPDDARARLVELKKLLVQQQQTQAALEAKLAEIEALL